MIRRSTILHRFYVRQRPSCCHHVVIAPPQSLFYFCEQQQQQTSATQQQLWTLRRSSSSVATNIPERHPIPLSDPSNNLPQNSRSNDENIYNLPIKYIDFTTASKIEGDESHIATITLQHGETLRAESGSMIFMTEGVACKYFCLVVGI